MQLTTDQIIQLLALNFIADNSRYISFDREKLQVEAEALTTYLESFGKLNDSDVDFTEVVRQICNNLMNGDENQQKEIEVTKA